MARPPSGPAGSGPIPPTSPSTGCRCAARSCRTPTPRPPGQVRRHRGCSRSTASGGSAWPRRPRRSPTPTSTATPTTRAGIGSLSPATGRCRAATARTTRTSGCRSTGRRPTSPTTTRRASTARRSACPRAWRGRRVVLHVGGAESVLYVWVNGDFVAAWARTAGCRPSSTSRRCVEPGGELRWSCVVVRWTAPATSRTRTTGGWPACTARSTSGATVPSTSPTYASTPGWPTTPRPEGARCVRHRHRRPRRSAEALGAGWRVRGAPRATRRPHGAAPRPRARRAADLLGPLPASAATSRASTPRCPGSKPWSAEDPQRYRVLVSLIDPRRRGPGGRRRQRIGFRSVEVAGRAAAHQRPAGH